MLSLNKVSNAGISAKPTIQFFPVIVAGQSLSCLPEMGVSSAICDNVLGLVECPLGPNLSLKSKKHRIFPTNLDVRSSFFLSYSWPQSVIGTGTT